MHDTFSFHFQLPSTIFYKYVKVFILKLDFCDHVKDEKYNYFTVSMLKETCTFFELPFKLEISKLF